MDIEQTRRSDRLERAVRGAILLALLAAAFWGYAGNLAAF
ncbi:hypothetical protein GCM10028862_23580 [Luteimonas pelagia]